MEILVFAIPFVVALFLLCFYRRETVWWEYLVLIVPSLLLGLLLEFCFKSYNTSDVEYLSTHVVKLRHTDRWNEWIHKTCTRTRRVGKHTVTTHYDCSYCEDHPERWIYYTSGGSEIYTDQETWERMRKRLGVSPKFVDMHRRYYTIDGDAQDYEFDGSWKKSVVLDYSESYENPVLGSRSLFRFSKVHPDSVESLGLYEYPLCPGFICDSRRQETVLGMKITDLERTKLAWFNRRNSPRVYILVWPSTKYGPAQAELQRSLWEGGNRHELLVCIGLKPGTREITWVRCYSWEDKPVVSVKTRMYLESSKKLDILKLADFLGTQKWIQKNFEDFKYLSVEISDTQYVFLIILILVYNIGMSAWIILNEYTNDEDYTKTIFS